MADNSFTRMGSLLASVPELQQAKDARMAKTEQIAWRAAAGKEIFDHTVIRADRESGKSLPIPQCGVTRLGNVGRKYRCPASGEY